MFPLLELPQEVVEGVYALVTGGEERRALRLVSRRSKALVDGRVSAVVLPTGVPGFHYRLELPPLAVLCAAPWSLRKLDLHELPLSLAKLGHLTAAAWPLLEVLSLRGCAIEPDTGSILSKGAWPCLRSLDLGGNRLHDRGCEALASGAWPRLLDLNLSRNSCSWGGFGILAKRASGWSALQRLNLNGNCMGYRNGAGLHLLPWTGLRSLELEGNQLEDDQLAQLAASSLPQLRHLVLERNKSRPRGWQCCLDAAGAPSPTWTCLCSTWGATGRRRSRMPTGPTWKGWSSSAPG